jgi:DNA-binding response OmpR family regulator
VTVNDPQGTGGSGVAPGSAGRVLVVDDEQHLAALVGKYLERDGFEVTLSFDGVGAVGLARTLAPDVLVLDLGLPGLDGLEVCRQVRTFSDCYVLMLTARGEEVDKLIGLSVGADDYLTKPFSPRELVARVHVLLRRPRDGATGSGGVTEPRGAAGGPSGGGRSDERAPLCFGPLTIDRLAREVHLAGVVVDLTRTEFDVLTALAARPRMAFNRRQLIEEVWGPSWVGDEHLVDVHIGHLRRKLGDDAGAPRFVRTVRGVGYRMGEG